MELWVMILLGYILVLGLVFLDDVQAASRRDRLRLEASSAARGPSPNWRPVAGERVTLFRTNRSSDLVAEILRATARKYAEVARAHDLEVQVQELEIPQRRGPVEGRITFEIVPFPATS